MQPALEALLGEGATGLSANTVSRLKQGWEQDYDRWRQRDLSKRRYVYLWSDGVYSQVRMDDKLCLLVLIGSDDTGRKEVLAVVAELFRISIDELLGNQPKKIGGKRGPASKLQQQIERLNELPKSKQKFVIEMIDTVLQQAS